MDKATELIYERLRHLEASFMTAAAGHFDFETGPEWARPFLAERQALIEAEDELEWAKGQLAKREDA